MPKKSFQDIDFDSIAIEQNDDILFITVAKYKLFLKHKDEGGLDAKALLDHYMFTARMQHTQSIKANDYYVMNGLGWGVRKLKRAKALLHKLGMIEYRQHRREDGTMGAHYVVLRMSGGSNFVPPVQETAPPVDRPSGDDKQLLKQENEMLEQEKKMPAAVAAIDVVHDLNSIWKPGYRSKGGVQTIYQRVFDTFWYEFPRIHGCHFVPRKKDCAFCAQIAELIEQRFHNFDEQAGYFLEKANTLMNIARAGNEYQRWSFTPGDMIKYWDKLFDGAERVDARSRHRNPAIDSMMW